MFSTQIGKESDLGLLKINYKNCRDRLLEDKICSPTTCITKLHTLLPDLLKERCTHVRKWLMTSKERLNSVPASVEEYVIQTNALAIISSEIDN